MSIKSSLESKVLDVAQLFVSDANFNALCSIVKLFSNFYSFHFEQVARWTNLSSNICFSLGSQSSASFVYKWPHGDNIISNLTLRFE